MQIRDLRSREGMLHTWEHQDCSPDTPRDLCVL